MQVNLAISLHAPNDEIRSKLMRINKAYNIAKLMGAIDYYLMKNNRRIQLFFYKKYKSFFLLISCILIKLG